MRPELFRYLIFKAEGIPRAAESELTAARFPERASSENIGASSTA